MATYRVIGLYNYHVNAINLSLLLDIVYLCVNNVPVLTEWIMPTPDALISNFALVANDVTHGVDIHDFFHWLLNDCNKATSASGSVRSFGVSSFAHCMLNYDFCYRDCYGLVLLGEQ